MLFKHNYFLRNSVDLEKSVKDYILDSDVNYVILEDNIPLMWGDKTPVIYGDEASVMNELVELDAVDENGNMKGDWKVMTELDFILTFCLDVVTKLIKEKVIDKGEFDGICHITYLDLNDTINIDGMTDILNASVNKEDGHLVFLISDKDDTKQTFETLSSFNEETILKIIFQIF